MRRFKHKRLKTRLGTLTVCAFAMCLLVCSAGCQVLSTGFQSSPVSDDGQKSISQIAQESINIQEQREQEDTDFGGFKTLNPETKKTSNRAVKNGSRSYSSPIRKPRRPNNSEATGRDVLIDEIFEQTDVRDAIQAIASQANVSIIVDDQVAGVVTTLIQNEPLEQALEKVLLPLGLHHRYVNGQYLICSSDPASPMFSLIADRLDYVPIFSSPAELVELLSEKNKQFVRIAAKRNMVIVDAPTKIANRIIDELRLFDRPVPQVVLEAMVVVVSPDSGFQFGTNLQQAYTQDDSNFNVNLDALEFSGNISGSAARNLFRNFSVTSYFVRALEQEGYLSIRATPHVMAKNGEKAEISIARESFFSTQPVDAQAFFRQDIQKVEAGISLIITPTIRGDNVTMVIEKAEVSEDIRATVNDPAVDNPFPLINRRQVSTTVHVNDGETIVIGGLMQNQLVDRTSRVPFFSDLPLIGRLFTQVVKEEQAAEVVVFISPRIVHQKSDHPMDSNVQDVQAYNEFSIQRRFPRDNGLEIGGPIANHGAVQYGYPDPAVQYQQQVHSAAEQYVPAQPQMQQYSHPQEPVYQQAPVYQQDHQHSQPQYQQPAYHQSSHQRRAQQPAVRSVAASNQPMRYSRQNAQPNYRHAETRKNSRNINNSATRSASVVQNFQHSPAAKRLPNRASQQNSIFAVRQASHEQQIVPRNVLRVNQ